MKYTDAELRNLIVDRFTMPRHRCRSENKWENAQTWSMRSESCSDHLQITVLLKDGKVEKACFDGHACAVAIASTDIMIDKIMGQDLKALNQLSEQYKKLINFGLHHEALDETILGELVAFKNIYRQRNRKACALLVTVGLDNLLTDNGK